MHRGCGRCMEGALKVHRRYMEGAQRVDFMLIRFLKANDLIGCGWDPYPMIFILHAQKVHKGCVEGMQKVCRGCAEGTQKVHSEYMDGAVLGH